MCTYCSAQFAAPESWHLEAEVPEDQADPVPSLKTPFPIFFFFFTIKSISINEKKKKKTKQKKKWIERKEKLFYFIEPRIMENVEAAFLNDGWTMTLVGSVGSGLH